MAKQEQIVQEIISEEKFGDHIVLFSEVPYEVLLHVDNTKSGTGSPDPAIVLIKRRFHYRGLCLIRVWVF